MLNTRQHKYTQTTTLPKLKRDHNQMNGNSERLLDKNDDIQKLPREETRNNDISNINKKLKVHDSGSERYRRNLLKFEQYTECLDDGNSCFELSAKLFTATGVQSFEDMHFYNSVLRNGSALSHGLRLSNISRRIMNKNRFSGSEKEIKKDGLKSFYTIALKHRNASNHVSEKAVSTDIPGKNMLWKRVESNAALNNGHLSSSMKPVSSTASLFQKKFTSSFLTNNSKKSLFNTLPATRTNTRTATPTSSSKSLSKKQPKHYDYKKHYYSSDESDDYDFKPLPRTASNLFENNRKNEEPSRVIKQAAENDSSSVFSSDISLSSESESDDFEDDEEYWNDQFTPGKLRGSNKKTGDTNPDEDMAYSDDERDKRFDLFYHKKWDNLLKHNDLMHSNHAMKRIDTFEGDNDSVFDDRRKAENEHVAETKTRESISNAPVTAHTLLPVAFHTHMFVPNELQKGSNYAAFDEESQDAAMGYVADEDDFKFYSEQQETGVNEPAVKQAVKEDNEFKLLKQKQLMQDLRKYAEQKNNSSLFKS